MSEITQFYQSGDMNSIETLEDTCNTDELNLLDGSRLQSLDTVNVDGKKATEAVYKADDDHTNLGMLIIKRAGNDVEAEEKIKANKDDFLFKGKAFIRTVSTKVLVFRQ
jgi:hypothetical protein